MLIKPLRGQKGGGSSNLLPSASRSEVHKLQRISDLRHGRTAAQMRFETNYAHTIVRRKNKTCDFLKDSGGAARILTGDGGFADLTGS